MKKIVFFLLVLFTATTFAQKSTAKKNASGDLVGIANKADFKQQPYNNWFSTNYNNYTIDKATAKKLKKALKGVTIKGFMGTWCGDSKRETPKFYKLLDLAKFDLKNLEMVTVNRAKKTPDNLQKGLDIRRVPTFIFYKKEKEIGRYVEYARETLEKDILKIVTGKKYKHAYDYSN
ncbi:MAG: thioredoxin family protein [Flavobacteriaceae bacterium]|nr:thioredoxin family protein [Flavobacteriaceae bacterium]